MIKDSGSYAPFNIYGENIDTVMSAQQDLIDILGVFNPSLVKMAPAGEKAED